MNNVQNNTISSPPPPTTPPREIHPVGSRYGKRFMKCANLAWQKTRTRINYKCSSNVAVRQCSWQSITTYELFLYCKNNKVFKIIHSLIVIGFLVGKLQATLLYARWPKTAKYRLHALGTTRDFSVRGAGVTGALLLKQCGGSKLPFLQDYKLLADTSKAVCYSYELKLKTVTVSSFKFQAI